LSRARARSPFPRACVFACVAGKKVRFFELCAHLARRQALTRTAADARAAARAARALDAAARRKVEARPMQRLARQPGATVPLASVGRDTTFKTLYSGLATLETVRARLLLFLKAFFCFSLMSFL
jgi:hypothetical protein